MKRPGTLLRAGIVGMALAAAVPLMAQQPQTHMEGDDAVYSYTLLNRLEFQDAKPGSGFAWEGGGWIGGDIDRFWWRSEGERIDGRTEAADLQALFGRSFTPWWDWVAGIRHDFRPGGSRDFAAFGVQGLAPQRFEVALTGYFGTGSQTAVRFETRYDLLLSNRLVLQPLLEMNLYGRTDAARGIGSGLSTMEAGLRLRYEISRRFAPYAGVVRQRAGGNTADLRRTGGESVGDTRLVAGVRTWF